MIRTASRLVATAVAVCLLAGPAFAAEPSASELALAREVAISSGMTRSIDAMVEPFFTQLRSMNVTRPEIKKDLDEVIATIRPEVEQQKQKVIDDAARAFAARLSEDELKQIAAFYKSPAGKKYVEVQPGLLDDIVKDLAGWAQTMSEYVMVRARAEMAKRGFELQ